MVTFWAVIAWIVFVGGALSGLTKLMDAVTRAANNRGHR